MTTELVLTRGLPASGKTTWAKVWIQQGPGRVRVNRDDLRASFYGRDGVLSRPEEEAITRVQRDTVTGFLRDGISVVVDDMNLRAKYARAWADLASSLGVGFRVEDFTHVPVDECVARDVARGKAGWRYVGEDVIRGMHARYLAAGRLAPVAATAPRTATCEVYVPPADAPDAWIFDIDGTLALGRFGEPGRRGPFDWARVGEDDINGPVFELVDALFYAGHNIIIMSGRDEVCRPETEKWLSDHNVPWHLLLMRPAGDTRKDAIVKAELFDKHVRHGFDVHGVVDDRQQVVDFWRSLGLMCAQVAPGAF